MAWKSCSGARAISSTLNTKPATALSADVQSTSSTPALSSVCSAHHHGQHGEREAPAAGEPERLGVGALLARRRRPARERPRHHDQREERRRRHPERHRVLPVGDADRHRDRERQPRAGLQEHEPAVEAEPLVPGQPAACEVARRVGEHRDDEDPVERLRAVEQVVLDRPAQDERDDEEGEREAALDQQRRAQRVVGLEAAGAAVGDRAREQLLDRPVDHRDGHEQHRPQQRDLLVLDVVQDVGRDREVRERHDPREGDADREDAGAAAVAGARGPGQSRTSSIVHGNGERASTTSPWRLSSATNARLDQWLTCPGVLPRSLM